MATIPWTPLADVTINCSPPYLPWIVSYAEHICANLITSSDIWLMDIEIVPVRSKFWLCTHDPVWSPEVSHNDELRETVMEPTKDPSPLLPGPPIVYPLPMIDLTTEGVTDSLSSLYLIVTV